MIINLGKITIISFSRKTNSIYFNYKLCNNLVTRSQFVKDVGVLMDCKLYFHQYIDYILSQGLKMLGLIRYIASSFFTLESLLVLYSSLVQSKLEYASVIWNLSLLMILPNLKELNKNLQRYVTPDSFNQRKYI
jgi:hypothetical protein